jgi:1-acyl-sn-glycerol-3-phosphate acyltransferase
MGATDVNESEVFRPTDEGEGWFARWAYWVCQKALVGVFKVYFRLTIEGRENVPKDGAFVLAPIHRSYLDTLLMCVIRRRLRFMGKDSMWKRRWSAWMLSTFGGFPVSRDSADRAALQTTIGLIEKGEPTVLFPEGERKSGPRTHPLKEGAVYVAARAGVPIIPVGIGGSEAAMPKGRNFIRPVKIHIVVGKPIAPPPKRESGRVSRKSVRVATDDLREILQDLYDRAQVRVGSPNEYEPGSEPQEAT